MKHTLEALAALPALMALGALGALGTFAAPAAAAGTGYDCLVEPWQVVEVRTAVEGIIQQVHVQRGDAIKKGQALVELQSGAERAAVDSAKYRVQMEGQIVSARSRIDYARKKLLRATELEKEQYGSAQARDEADAERRLAEAELQAAVEARELARLDHRRAVEQLALRTVASPLTGVVVDRQLNPGDLAEAGSGRKAVLRIAQIDPLRVDVVLPAALFGKVKAGQPAKVSLGTGSSYGARVTLVDKVVDSASGTFVARLELPNPKQDIPGGVSSRCEIDGVPQLALKAALARP